MVEAQLTDDIFRASTPTQGRYFTDAIDARSIRKGEYCHVTMSECTCAWLEKKWSRLKLRQTGAAVAPTSHFSFPLFSACLPLCPSLTLFYRR